MNNKFSTRIIENKCKGKDERGFPIRVDYCFFVLICTKDSVVGNPDLLGDSFFDKPTFFHNKWWTLIPTPSSKET